jgi:hypothetical protein
MEYVVVCILRAHSSFSISTSASARCTTATLAACLDHGAQRQLGLMEGKPFGENGVVTTFETFDESRSQRNAPFSCSIRDVTGATQQPLHMLTFLSR